MQMTPRESRPIPIPRGDAGVLGRTVPKMLQLIRDGRAVPIVRGFAVRLVSQCAPQDQRCRQARIYRWVSRVIRFVPDPRRVELLHEPIALLYTVKRQGWAAGDCDDIAIILATLLESVGIRTRLKMVATAPGLIRPLRHVFVEAHQDDGSWLRLDPIGRQFPRSGFTRQVAREV